jgi:peptidoglycan/LPS O-acetylase OafA/YrhL
MRTFQYRPELDGLRALAILTTMWSHAGFKGLSGSGIDFFFVISGYLVTSIALRDRARGTFSVRRYLLRRARRILPALVVVMLVTLPFAVVLMLPDELENYGQSLVATLFSGNNVLLYLTSGYWDLASEFKPFLHTWSLGVEEQFYLLFPLVLLVSHRLPKAVRTSALVLALASSLAIATVWGLTNPDAAYYLLPARAWEILVGCLIAVGTARAWPAFVAVSRRTQGVLAGVGLALVLASLVMAESEAGFRVPVVVTAVTGVGLIIAYASPGTLVTRVLANRMLVGIGTITFSVYLWHQPLFVFARIALPDTPPAWLFVLLMVAALGLGWLTWKFVEEPFRRPARMSLRTFVPVVAGAAAVVTLSGFALNSTNGLPSRLGEDPAVASIDYNRRIDAVGGGPFVRDDSTHVLVVGDSWSRDLANSVLETYPDVDLELRHLHGPTFDQGVCFLAGNPGLVDQSVYRGADLVLVAISDPYEACLRDELERMTQDGKAVFYGGPKNFGANLNWIMQRDGESRVGLSNPVPEWVLDRDEESRRLVPEDHYLSWSPVFDGGRVPITDDEGAILSPDRVHFTQAGARHFGQALRLSPLDDYMQELRSARD